MIDKRIDSAIGKMREMLDHELGCILSPRGIFGIEHWRNGIKINTYTAQNMVTKEGKDKLLSTVFGTETLVDPWYIGLIDNTNYSAGGLGISVNDTAAQIDSNNDWDEFTDYDETYRQEWDPSAAASDQAIGNSATPAEFNINVDDSEVKGVFLCSNATQGTGSSSDTLFATALFSSLAELQSGDTLKITYTVTA